MKKSAMLMGCILGLGIVLQSGSASAQGAAAGQGTAKGKGSATSKGPATGKSAAAGKHNLAAKTSSTVTLKDKRDKLSYALGMNLGTKLKQDKIDVEANALVQGLKDTLAGSKPLMTEDEARATLMQWQGELQAKQEEKMKQAADSNKKEGETFLAANKTKEGVVTLPSGLQYKIVTEGTGPKPTASDTVVCNYRGTLINGTEFDSSYKRGQPATFPVARVIKGWTEALQLMPVGSKWQLFIPSDLAYGERGAGGDIGPNATLIFEVEVISIQGK
ncbi:MAG TPA: FKBP-type peptidyl-prolyl cis-trans isomerase [Candidatus Solibacter sp.]|jgi:FKBP-type peptidyl-prolyl cis-trans isomerase FklB|nr:FKBP-type peptidyl-prolyl cis-trans isomerase [Candidatus Solibacter sp.]